MTTMILFFIYHQLVMQEKFYKFNLDNKKIIEINSYSICTIKKSILE